MKTYKVAVKTPRARYEFVEVIPAETPEEAIGLALGRHGEGSTIAFGTAPIEIDPVNWEPVKV